MSNLEKKVENHLLSFKDSTDIKIRVDDTDLMGVVHFKNYLMYFDEGFVNFLNKYCEPVNKIIETGIVFPVKKINITYENFARFWDIIRLSSGVWRSGE